MTLNRAALEGILKGGRDALAVVNICSKKGTMKNQTGMWIDGSKAVIITLVDGKERVEQVEADVENPVHLYGEGDHGVRMGSRHLSPEKKFDERRKNQRDQYLDVVLEKVKATDELYLFGPAETRTLLQHKIDAEKAYKTLSEKLRAVEPADTMTQKQIVAKVKKFYGWK